MVSELGRFYKKNIIVICTIYIQHSVRREHSEQKNTKKFKEFKMYIMYMIYININLIYLEPNLCTVVGDNINITKTTFELNFDFYQAFKQHGYTKIYGKKEKPSI